MRSIKKIPQKLLQKSLGDLQPSGLFRGITLQMALRASFLVLENLFED